MARRKTEKSKAQSRAQTNARAKPAPKRRRFRPFRWLGRLILLAMAVPTLWVLAYRWIDPPGGYYMATEWWRLDTFEREWRDIGEMSPHLVRSVIAAEDANFCAHWGFDIEAIRAAMKANEEGRSLRGASTISQQVAKNVFLWPERSWVRKGLEAGFTLLIEAFWPKERIVEVYLNMVEFDTGVFGAEAAAQHYFGLPAAELSLTQASRLAAVLPAPKNRSAADPSANVRKRARSITAGAETLRADGRAGCALP